jgi:RNA polymerase sigma factor (sigma-70 family)
MNTSTNVEVTMGGGSRGSTLAEFEQIYRANVGVLTAYFARRCTDPQTVADLTSETIVGAAGSFRSFDSGSGSARAWLFGIAAHVYADYCAQTANGRETVVRLAGMGDLPVDEIDELADRIDAQRAGRELIDGCSQLPALERAAIELVDLGGLTPKEAAAALGVPRGVLRMRLSRARARIRKQKEHHNDE